MGTTTAKPAMMIAKEACVTVVGARPIQYQRKIVRDRHTGKLVEIDLHEAPPVDEGDPGTTYVFRKGEAVEADHPAVLDAPGLWREPNEFDALR
jgi:hypothetical protein